MTFLILFASSIIILGCTVAHTRVKAARLGRLTWEDLIGRLQPVSPGVATIAMDYLQPTKGQLAIRTDQLWELVGEDEGLQRMRKNAETLIALAGYAQRWNFHESIVVAERMRRDGIALRRATAGFSPHSLFSNTQLHGPFNVQEAASAYHLMRSRLLALYETSHVGRYPALFAAV